jgi:flagellar hook-associated protein 3 FlgL
MTAIPRTTFLGANRAQQARLRIAYGRLEQANLRVSGGKAYARPSENPAAASRAAMLHEQLEQLTTFGRAIDDAGSRLSIADSKLGQAMDQYQRITELATQAANSLTNADARNSIRAEVLQIRDSLLAIANTSYLDEGLFAGYASGNAVVYDTGTSTYVFTGSAADTVDRRIGSGATVRANITAAEAFSTGSGNVFATLDSLATALAANDTPGIQATLPAIGQLRGVLSAAQARIGSSANRVDSAQSRNAAITITLDAERSKVEDVDLADAITDQGRLEVAYNAALGISARASTSTLLDWLR